MPPSFDEWERHIAAENNKRLREVETDVAVQGNTLDKHEEKLRDIDQRFIEHSVKTETTAEQLMRDIGTIKEEFSGFRGEVKGSISSLKIVIPVSITVIGAIVSGLIWLYSVVQNGIPGAS